MNRITNIRVSIVILWVSVLLLLLAGLSSCYEKLISNSVIFKGGVYLPDSQFVVFRSVRYYRSAKGLTAFPDGGLPKELYWNLSLYSVDLDQQKARKLDDFENLSLSHRAWYAHISFADSSLLYSLYQPVMKDSIIINSGLGIYLFDLKTEKRQKISDKGYRAVLSPDAREIAFLYKSHVFVYTISSEELVAHQFPVRDEPAYIKWDEATGKLCAFYLEGNWELSSEKESFIPSDAAYEKNYGQDPIPYQALKQIPDSVWGAYLQNNKLIIP